MIERLKYVTEFSAKSDALMKKLILKKILIMFIGHLTIKLLKTVPVI